MTGENHEEALKGFARDVIQTMWDGCVDGCDVQNLADKYGLIEQTIATEADAEVHDHVTPGDPFFRFSDWLKA